MKSRILSIGLAVIVGLASSGARVGAQSPQAEAIAANTSATITFASGQTAVASSRKGVFEQVGLTPNEVVNITVQYPLEAVGHAITAEPLDGGKMIGPSKKLVVDSGGIVQLKFQAGKEPGVYQISLHDGSQELGLQFWIPDPEELDAASSATPAAN